MSDDTAEDDAATGSSSIPHDVDADGGAPVRAPTALAVLEHIARSLTDSPDEVSIETEDRGRSVRFRVRVAPGDMGRLIGRRGRVAQAVRTMVRVGGARDGVETSVDFVDD
ncbi:MAG: KH domain-containing protein [Actinomycetota bacterium]|jgi:hypothetical protein|nr:KH domain-containing protein [Actinomycetota bacterium]